MSEWPTLPNEEWRSTRDTLHMYTQVIGKLRLVLSPFEPQWGHVPFYVTARGLTTSPIPIGPRALEAEFDLLGHELILRTSTGDIRRRSLGGDVADFYRDVMSMLHALHVEAARAAPDPRRAILDFLRSTYAGAAKLLGMDEALVQPPHPHDRGS